MDNRIVDDDDDGNVFWNGRDERECSDLSSPGEFQRLVFFQSECVDQSGLLGLSLKKSPSFINLIETELTYSKAMNKHMAKMQDFISQPLSEKLKASNFCAMLLKIERWQRISRHEGDLVGKCYYAKRKLVWEVLDGALKSKIEIQWSDIIGIRVTIKENEPGILEVELNQPPVFYKETNPQPRKHTQWHGAPDFTAGQALMCRRHYVKFPPGILDKHIEKLLQCDQRLLMLSQRPFPSQQSPYFDTHAYGLSQFSLDFNCQRSQIHPNCQNFPPSMFPLSYQRLRSNAGSPLRIADSCQPMPGHQTNGSMAVAGYNSVMENQTNAFWSGADKIADHANDFPMPSPITSVSRTNFDFITQSFNAMKTTTYRDGGTSGISSTRNDLLSCIENDPLGDKQEICSNEKMLIGKTSASTIDPLMFVGDRVADDQVMADIEGNFLQNGGLVCSEPIIWLPHTEFDYYPYDLPNQENEGF